MWGKNFLGGWTRGEIALHPCELKEVQCSWRAEWGRTGKVGLGSENRPDPAGLENLVSWNFVLRSVRNPGRKGTDKIYLLQDYSFCWQGSESEEYQKKNAWET